MTKAFTLIELIFVIVIIGVLAAVAIPKFSRLSDNAKISAELATASSVQAALDAANAEWTTTRCEFLWGPNDLNSSKDFSSLGYPNKLGEKLENVLKEVKDWTCTNEGASGSECRGPASSDSKGTSYCKENKPCKGKHWKYNATSGVFALEDD